MLIKIICPLLNHGEISFNNGLNVILGDDNAKNSIGKSSALMVIDFAMGGRSLLDDKAGVIKSMGHHYYIFEFIFDDIR
ncbi:chromosome partitioning protein ParA, partial [Citrobacter braakii]